MTPERWERLKQVFQAALEQPRERQQAFLASLGLLAPMRTEAGPLAAPLTPKRWDKAETVTISYGHGLAVAPLYDEPFMVAVPKNHPLAKRRSISAEELKLETMLLLGTGHCFRDHVLEVCPEYARFSSDAEGIRKSFEGSSLETIKYMVASGMGVTVVPQLSVPKEPQPHVAYIPFSGSAPTRRVVLAWRRTFTRYEAIAALRNAIYACPLEGVTRLTA